MDEHEANQGEANRFVDRYFHGFEADSGVSSLQHTFAPVANQIVSNQCVDHRQRMRALEKLRESLEAAALSIRM